MTTTIDEYLEDLAAQAGIRIEYAHLRHSRDGESYTDRKLIRLRPGMAARLHRCVLAHELAHHAFGDVPSHFGPVHSKQERRADEWAALRLISPADYRHVEELHSGHLGAMALELGVMRSIVEAFQAVLLRLGDTVYVRPKMGAGNWAHREDVA
ncbi:ImmA/IrrE family metallo-endopeptidase [Microbacterium sp. cx-59]|uniref:ImmA/IrrE family metallo-endopeptidase n=1 Tax=Microbacterium sp. cx-59 TaxID=2891207 RepID=UPI001E41FA7F|nr:ImmA/IrrE family metallo-endopeptidase [Microbacterium sp. cx-59]MCC4906925.1 ImmA/IrrE family metallo-endopeptidase [Microbacterium sp. cx-59]